MKLLALDPRILQLGKLFFNASCHAENSKFRKKISVIIKLAEDGRGAKARNVWDEQWEEGVNKFIKAYDDVDRLIDELEKYYLRAQQISQNKKNSKLAHIGLVLTALFGISGVLFGISGWFSEELRKLFGQKNIEVSPQEGENVEEPETTIYLTGSA